MKGVRGRISLRGTLHTASLLSSTSRMISTRRSGFIPTLRRMKQRVIVGMNSDLQAIRRNLRSGFIPNCRSGFIPNCRSGFIPTLQSTERSRECRNEFRPTVGINRNRLAAVSTLRASPLRGSLQNAARFVEPEGSSTPPSPPVTKKAPVRGHFRYWWWRQSGHNPSPPNFPDPGKSAANFRSQQRFTAPWPAATNGFASH